MKRGKDLKRQAAAELVGTLLLVAAVVGSGIMAERLAGGNVALALLANTIATGAALVALILTFGPISGAHFNPAVSVSDALAGGLSWRELGVYVSAQCLGGLLGAALAHLMFGLSVFSLSTHARSGPAQFLSEFVAAFGLMAVIWGCSRTRSTAVPFAIAAYITAAYWFTASTSFANPAVTLARAFSNSFAGIRPQDAPAFVVAQFSGALAGTLLFCWLLPNELSIQAAGILMPHPATEQAEDGNVKTYLFACVHNAGRSQMAAALFNHYAGVGCRAISAGTRPAEHIHPEVVQAMLELGIDLSGAKPQKLTEELLRQVNTLVTMGCGEACPLVPGVRMVDWSIPDPKGQPLEAVRRVRDEIQEQVKRLLSDECADCCADLALQAKS